MNFRFCKPISWFISLVSAAAAPMIFASEVNKMGCYVNFVKVTDNIHCSKCKELLAKCCARFMCKENCPKCINKNLCAARNEASLFDDNDIDNFLGPCVGTQLKSVEGNKVFERFKKNGVFYFSSDLLIKKMRYPTAESWFKYCKKYNDYTKNTYCAYCMKKELDNPPLLLRTRFHKGELGKNGECPICMSTNLNEENTYACKGCGNHVCSTCSDKLPECPFCRLVNAITKAEVIIIPDNVPIETNVDYIPKNEQDIPQQDFDLSLVREHGDISCFCCQNREWDENQI